MTNITDAIDFLKVYRPAGPWCLTSIIPDGTTTTDTFWPKTEDKLREFIVDRNGQENIYFHVNNTGDTRLKKKPAKNLIRSAEFLHVDIDPDPKLDLVDERDRILKLLEAYEPRPSIIIDSGGGYQGFWRLDTPLPTPDESARDVIERRNMLIELDLAGTTVCANIDRIMRLPGTLNVLNRKKKKQGREVSVAALIWAEDTTYRLDEFELAPEPKKKKAKPLEGTIVPKKMTDEIQAVANGHRVATDGEVSWKSASEHLLAFCGYCVRAGWTLAQVKEIALDKSWPVSDHALNENDSHRAVERAWEEAQPTDGFEQNNNKIVQSRSNFAVALDKLGIEVRHNEFSGTIEINGEPVTDETYNELTVDFIEEFHWKMTDLDFRRWFTDHAYKRRYNPIRDYLDGLEWDGQLRIDKFLTTNTRAADNEYTRAVSRLLFLGATWRAMEPGCKFDEVIILEGPQGMDKSNLVRELMPDQKYFTDSIELDGDSKKAVEVMSGKWIGEVPELGRTTKVAQVKKWTSQQSDKVRLAYRRDGKDFPRHFIIVATTNEDDYLQDQTGNRRFWPIKCADINLDFDRDQLWAEALVAYKNGEGCRLDQSLWDIAAQEQDKRLRYDGVAERLRDLLGRGKNKVSAHWIYDQMELNINDTKTQNAIGRAMRSLGWERKTVYENGGPRSGWWRILVFDKYTVEEWDEMVRRSFVEHRVGPGMLVWYGDDIDTPLRVTFYNHCPSE